MCSRTHWTSAAAEMQAAGAAGAGASRGCVQSHRDGALAAAVQQRFGAPHFVFNNAGVGCGGLVWENTLADWEWVMGVNVMGVVHGVRLFTPMMLEAAQKDPSYQWPYRQHRQHGRAADAAQHGHLQRQQARRGQPD
jgi:NAD(P)-dependent dehydrogenase (short-subunit alcohol dehydrogenase family)